VLRLGIRNLEDPDEGDEVIVEGKQAGSDSINVEWVGQRS